jgi:hypothetical protein
MSKLNVLKFGKSRHDIDAFLNDVENTFVNDYEFWKEQYCINIFKELWPYYIPTYNEFCIALLERLRWYFEKDNLMLLENRTLIFLAIRDLQVEQWDKHKKRLDKIPTS